MKPQSKHTARLATGMAKYTEPLINGIVAEDMPPIEKIALMKLLAITLESMADYLERDISDPQTRAGAELILGL